MLTLLLAGGRGLRNGIDALLARDGINSLWISALRTTSAFEGLGAGRAIQLQADDAEALARAMSELAHTSPRQRLLAGTNITYGARNAAVPVQGVGLGFFQANPVEISRGRPLSPLDHQRARRVALVGDGTRALLFENGPGIGAMISIGGTDFEVVGVFTDASSESETLRIYIPYSTLATSFDASGNLDSITAIVQPSARLDAVRDRVSRLLARRHRFDPRDKGAIRLWFSAEQEKKVRQVLRGIDVAILAVGLGTLISGMVGVSNILFVGVRERAKEFAIRRALGATARSVLTMVLTEALFLSGLAGGLGLICALGLVQLLHGARIRSDYFRDPSVDVETALASVLLLIGSALVAGYFPAREAARSRPIQALRRE